MSKLILCVDWRPIAGWPYEVSNHGQVRRVGKARTLLPKLDKDGYPRATLCDMTRLQTFKVHTLICYAFHGPPPEGTDQVRHLDGTKDNNTPDNLCWGTALDNAADRLLHGNHARGEKSARAKLSQAEVDQLRAEYDAMKRERAKDGFVRIRREARHQLLEKYGLNINTLTSIVGGHGYNWKGATQ